VALAGQVARQFPSDFKVHPLSDVLGGEVVGFDLRSLVAETDNTAFLHAVCKSGVLVFRDQKLTAADFVALSRFCGEIEFHVLDQYRMEDHPEIYVLSNVIENGKPIGDPKNGFGWHSDLSYMQRPTAYTILYGVQTPPVGAETLFCSTFKAYESLDDSQKARLEKLSVVHSYTYMRNRNKRYIENNAVSTPLTREQAARTPDVIHPLIRTHPITGRRSLYLGGDDITEIQGLSEAETRSLVEELFEFAIQERFRFVQEWQPRDVVIWDNRGTMHTATEYDREKYRRLIWRTSIRGEVPF